MCAKGVGETLDEYEPFAFAETHRAQRALLRNAARGVWKVIHCGPVADADRNASHARMTLAVRPHSATLLDAGCRACGA